MQTALRLLTTALVGWAGAVSSLTVLFGNPMAEQLLFTEAAGQSEKALSVWLHQDPLPAVTPLWGALTDIDGRGLAAQGMVLLWALGLVAVYALGWAHRPGPAWRRGATFGIAVWAMVYVFLEVWVPFNLLGEPFHLFALELALGLVAMVAAVVAIAGAHSRLATHPTRRRSDSMSTLLNLTRVEAAMLLREPAALLFTLTLPLMLLTLNGSGGNAPQAQFGGAGVVDVMLPGLLLLVLCTSGLMALPETLANYRERGFLRRLRISPMRPWQVLGSHALTHVAVAVVGLVLLVGLGSLAFDLTSPAGWGPSVAAIALSAAAVLGVGFLLAAVLPTVRTTQAVAAAIYFPAIFVSGVVFPVEALPTFAQRVGQAMPFSYGVRAMRTAWSTGGVDWVALAVLAATAGVTVAAGLRMFRWEARY